MRGEREDEEMGRGEPEMTLGRDTGGRHERGIGRGGEAEKKTRGGRHEGNRLGEGMELVCDVPLTGNCKSD